MNLYKILFSHTAPKDTMLGIETYLLAESEEKVYDYIDKKYNYNHWRDENEDEDTEPFALYDDDYNVIGTETFREKIMRIHGEIWDEDYDYADAYYGITLYGWELVKEDITDDLTIFIDLGIIQVI